MSIVALHNISKVYANQQTALRHVSFSVAPGEMLFLVGASGAGKSTVLRLLSGGLSHTVGILEVLGHRFAAHERVPCALRQSMGIVFQDYKLLHRLTVLQNVSLPLELVGVAHSVRVKRAFEMLDYVGLRDKADEFPLSLSGGEQQRVAIARALVTKPQLVLADEPTGNVDPAMARQIFSIFEHVNQAGIAVIMATHNLDLVDRTGQRVVLLQGGTVLHDSAPIQQQEAL